MMLSSENQSQLHHLSNTNVTVCIKGNQIIIDKLSSIHVVFDNDHMIITLEPTHAN